VRKVIGIPRLIAYLDQVGYPLTEDQIVQLMRGHVIPHSKPYQNIVSFDLDHIDSWISQRK